MENQFITFTGFDGQKLTVNLNYLIRYEPHDDGTMIYVDDRAVRTKYPVTIDYHILNEIVNARLFE